MLTKLEIINDMLASTGTAPVSAASTRHPAYLKALNKLEKVSRVMQGRGYWFNKSVRTLNPNTAGEIILPSTTLHADPVDTRITYTIRGGKLYDLANGTSVIGAPVKIVFIEQLDVEDMPPAAQNALQAHAVYTYFVDADGKDPKLSEYRNTAGQAAATLRGEQLRHSDVNFFNGSTWRQHVRPGSVRRLPLTDWN